MWYAAHAVMLIRIKDGEQTEFPIWENIFLIEAATPEEAQQKAEVRALEDESEADNTDTWDGRPSRFEFLGLRKLMQCFSDEEQPGDGTEVSHNKITFADREQLDKFVAGEQARLTIYDEYPVELEDFEPKDVD